MPRLAPALIVTTTAFAAAGERGRADAARRGRRSGAASRRRHHQARGLASIARAGSAPPILPCMSCCPNSTAACSRASIAFKNPSTSLDGLAFTGVANQPEPDRVDAGGGSHRGAGAACRRRRARERRIAVLMPDYPGAPGRTGYAVGLDVPASVHGAARRSCAGGLHGRGHTRRRRRRCSMHLDSWRRLDADRVPIASCLATLPLPMSANSIWAAWGAPEDDPDVRDGAFRFRAKTFGNVIVALPPDRGRAERAGAPTITIRRCRRATRCSPSDCGCGTPPASTRSSTWARMAHWNGCRARPSR